MSTIASTTINSDNPSARVCVTANVKDYWDSTNKRYKSGIVKTSITAISISGTVGGGEKVDIDVWPPNYDLTSDSKAHYSPAATGAVAGFSTFVQVTAINYGLPGPSARVEADGSITLACVDVSLPSGSDSGSSITVTVTYTTAFTNIDPYSALTGTTGTVTVQGGVASSVPWSVVGFDPATVAANGYYVVQLNTLTTTVRGGATFQAANPAVSASPIINLSYPLPVADNRVWTMTDTFTCVYAVNGGLIDGNATPVNDAAEAANLYNLLNVGVSNVSGGKAAATLAYTYATGSV